MTVQRTQEFIPPTLVKVIRSKHYGRINRAVVAVVTIKAGTLIEACPVIRIPYDEVYGDDHPNPTISWYCFGWSAGFTSLALGFGSLYNHSKTPNADYKPQNGDCLVIKAIKDIPIGEEVTIDYFPDEPDNHGDFVQRRWQ